LIGCAKQLGENSLPVPVGEISVVSSGYPAVAMVVLPGGQGMCTGTFVSARAVLTATHCAEKDGTYVVHTSFGDFTTTTHLTFGTGQVDDPNDIALLIFENDVADRSQGQVYDLGKSVQAGDVLRLVGFGCDDINSRSGAGVKRTGTNEVAEVNDYVDFLTPESSANASGTQASQRILGPGNRAASCFGDSGGPALAITGNNNFVVVAVTHAGGTDGQDIISEYVNVATRSDNRDALRQANSEYNLGIVGL
jgi:hypothetical protein